jgi:cardiolipin synthase
MYQNDEQLVFDGNEYEALLLKEIQESKQGILISCYILENEVFGNKILHALRQRASQGVRVCMVIDGIGSRNWINEHLKDTQKDNFEIRVFHPVVWQVLRWNLWRVFARFNRRNHQKLFIFDEKVAIIGSRNINNEAIEWRETSIRIAGQSVLTLVSLFETIWQRSHDHFFRRFFPGIRWKTHLKISSSRHIFSNHTYSLRKKIQRVTLQKIIEAKEKIKITTPYFFPTRKVLSSLIARAKAGVSVAVLLPKESDVLVSKWVSQYHYQRLLEAGVSIYEYNPKILHAKSMVIDEWALIGSSNFNRRSVFRDLELDYAVDSVETVQILLDQFREDLNHSTKIEVVPDLGFFKKNFIVFITRFFSSWF